MPKGILFVLIAHQDSELEVGAYSAGQHQLWLALCYHHIQQVHKVTQPSLHKIVMHTKVDEGVRWFNDRL